jgi:hypothetical protein
MIPQDLSGDAEVSVQVRVGTPSPVFVQVFILMALGMTICVSYARGGFVAVFVGEEKTSGGRSVADSAV